MRSFKQFLDHPNCGTPDCCQMCDTEVVEQKRYNVNFGVDDVTVKAPSPHHAVKAAQKHMLNKNPKLKGNKDYHNLSKYRVTVIEEKDPRLARAGVSGFNKAKRTPGHPTKSHIVVAKDGDKVKTIRFGQQGVTTAGAPKKGESDKQKARRASFKARHAKNIAKGKMSAAYWADKEKW